MSVFVVSEYVNRPEIYQEITKLRSKEMPWGMIASRLSKRLGNSINHDALRSAWRRAEKRIPTQSLNSIKSQILEYDNYMLIGKWYSQKLMSWQEIADRFSKRIGMNVSPDHIEDSWHEGKDKGYPVFQRVTLAEYIAIPENYTKITNWRNNDEMTWGQIAEYLSKIIKRDVSGKSVMNRYNESRDNGLPELCEHIEFINQDDIYQILINLRFEEFRSWPKISEYIAKTYHKSISADLLKERTVARFQNEQLILKNKKKKGILFIDGQEMTYADIALDSENKEEIKMWLYNSGYSWQDIEKRLSRRYGIPLDVKKLRDAWNSQF